MFLVQVQQKVQGKIVVHGMRDLQTRNIQIYEKVVTLLIRTTTMYHISTTKKMMMTMTTLAIMMKMHFMVINSMDEVQVATRQEVHIIKQTEVHLRQV